MFFYLIQSIFFIFIILWCFLWSNLSSSKHVKHVKHIEPQVQRQTKIIQIIGNEVKYPQCGTGHMPAEKYYYVENRVWYRIHSSKR